MSSRFLIPWVKLNPMFKRLRDNFVGADAQLIDAFNECVESRWVAASMTELERHLRAVCDVSHGPAFPLLNTISKLLLRSPNVARSPILEASRVETGIPHEYLMLDASGAWKVAWCLVDHSPTDDDYVFLSWYRPDEAEREPIVPIPLIDSIAGCVNLYRSKLILPALAALTMAYESVLWEALAAQGIVRSTARREFRSVNWKLKKIGPHLVVIVEGADDNVSNIAHVPGEPFEQVQVRMAQMPVDQAGMAELVVKISGANSKYLASSSVINEEMVSTRGLRNAVELARSRNIDPIAVVPKPLDETFIAIRNSLVHFPANGRLDTPIPMLGQAAISDVSALASDSRLFINLLTLVVGVIETTYGDVSSV